MQKYYANAQTTHIIHHQCITSCFVSVNSVMSASSELRGRGPRASAADEAVDGDQSQISIAELPLDALNQDLALLFGI